MSKIVKKISFHKIAICVLAFIIIFGGIIKCDQIQVFGVIVTLYRVAIPIFVCGIIIKKIIDHTFCKNFSSNKLAIVFFCIMTFWILYGAVSMIISPYSEMKSALKELISLFLGACSVYCIYDMCNDKASTYTFFYSLRFFCILLIAFALFESLTGIHLFTSHLYKEISYIDTDISPFVGLGIEKLFLTTTVFYGVNDFSTFLGIMLPLFFYNGEYSTGKNVINMIAFFSGLMILCIDDANIVLIAVLVALVVYCILAKNNYKNNILFATCAVGFDFVGYQLVRKLLLLLKSLFKKLFYDSLIKYEMSPNAGQEGQASNNSVTDVIQSQMESASVGSGSLHSRITMYIESVQVTLNSYGLGVGPAGFMPYFKKNTHESGLVNPHNWWLEILTQYGIFVFVTYVGFLVYEYVNVMKIYLKNRDPILLILISMCTCFIIACISPSSYLGYTYQWILPALCLVIINLNNTDKWFEYDCSSVIE